MLYHDIPKNFMVWLYPPPGEPGGASLSATRFMKDYQFRLVATPNELMEKIYIFESGLDDRVIEFLKLMLRLQANETANPIEGEFLFAKADAPSSPEPAIYFQIVKAGGNNGLRIPLEKYQKLSGSLAAKLSKIAPPRDKWSRVDQEFAKTLLGNDT